MRQKTILLTDLPIITKITYTNDTYLENPSRTFNDRIVEIVHSKGIQIKKQKYEEIYN